MRRERCILGAVMADLQDMNGPSAAIAARSKRQAMDWSLVLASQGIAAVIARKETGWVLIVDAPDCERAEDAIRQYQIENQSWGWRREVPGTGLLFHWGALPWALGLAAIYYWSMVRFPGLQSAGMVDSRAVMGGQWWRLFTAVTLHENLSHLASNAATGFLLMGLAMARYGPGVAALTVFLAGAVGNGASVLLYPEPHYSLGASGMVTGALGLIVVQSFADWRKDRQGAALFRRAVAAGILILVLIGFSPGTDLAAHIGGFLGGAGFGLALGQVKPAALQRSLPNIAAGLMLGGLVAASWLMAAR